MRTEIEGLGYVEFGLDILDPKLGGSEQPPICLRPYERRPCLK